MMKIMLVEDNETIILGLEYLLSREGYQGKPANIRLNSNRELITAVDDMT